MKTEFDSVFMASVREGAQTVREVDGRGDVASELIQIQRAELSGGDALLVQFLVAVRIPAGVETEVFVSVRFQFFEEDFKICERLFFRDAAHVAVETVPSARRNFRFFDQHFKSPWFFPVL